MPPHIYITVSGSMTFLLLALVAGPDAVVMQDKFKQAEQLYAEGRVHEALPAFDELLAEPDLAPALRIEAQKYQAFALYLMQLYPEAKESWLKLLRLSPSYTLDPMWVSPELHAFFGRLRPPDAPRAGPETPPDPTPTPTPTPTPSKPDPPVLVQPTEPTRGCGVVLCLVPFGVGQFANERVGKGVLFAAIEALSLGANVGLYMDRRREFENNGGLRDPSLQRDLFTVQRGALVVFGVSLVGGIIDAYLFP